MGESAHVTAVHAFSPEEPPAPSVAWGSDADDDGGVARCSRASNMNQGAAAGAALDGAVRAPAAVAGDAQRVRDEGGDDDTTSESDEDEVPLDAQGQLLIPRIQDSEEHDIKFLGRLTINGTPDDPPNVSACTTAVTFLRKVSAKRRQQFCGSVTAPQIMRISANVGRVVCRPKDPASTSAGLIVNLGDVSCVSHIHGDMCFVTGRLQPSGEFKFFAYAFGCASSFASQYLAQEILRACRHVFMIRRMQRSRNAIIAANERQQAQMRQRQMLLARQQGQHARGGAPPPPPAHLPPHQDAPSGHAPAAANGPTPPSPTSPAERVEDTPTPAADPPAAPQPLAPRDPTASDRYFYKERTLILKALAEMAGNSAHTTDDANLRGHYEARVDMVQWNSDHVAVTVDRLRVWTTRR